MNLEGLLALNGQPPRVDISTAGSIARELYGLTARVSALAGERDRNFLLELADGRRFVLKFIDPQADDTVVAGQSAALSHLLEQAGELPVPRLVKTLDGAELAVATLSGGVCRVRLVTYLAGRLAVDVALNAQQLQAIGRQIARLDQALRGFFHPALAQPIAWDLRRAAALLPLLPQVATTAARELVSAALQPLPRLLPRLRALRSQAIHGDCHARNLVIAEQANESVGIIDLGDMIHAPLVLEPAVTMAEFLMDDNVSFDGLCDLLAGYASAQALEPADLELLHSLILARIAVSALIQVWRQQQPLSAGDAPGGDVGIPLAALDRLMSRGREQLTSQWSDAAGITGSAHREYATGPARIETADRTQETAAAAGQREALLRRRYRALGANAELSYLEPIQLVRGDGVWVFDSDGTRYLDVYNNVPHVGHAHPVVVEAIARQAARIASNTRYLDATIINYAERLQATLPAELDTCLFVNSGSEANDVAWRIARHHSGQSGALVMNSAYHGITEATCALSPAIGGATPPYVEQLAAPVTAADHDQSMGAGADSQLDVDRALSRLRQRGFGIAALMLDGALTSSGIFDPPSAWLKPIIDTVRAAGGLLIADEVQIGLGRSGSDFWGFNRRGYVPDIVTLGKPVGNGYPLGVVITRRVILERFQRDTGFFSTFGGNPVAAAAGLAVLDVLEAERLVQNARATGAYFKQRLRELLPGRESLRQVRGSGLLLGVELAEHPGRTASAYTRLVVNGLRQRGVLIGSEGPRANVLKLRPPMPFQTSHVDIVIGALAAVLDDE